MVDRDRLVRGSGGFRVRVSMRDLVLPGRVDARSDPFRHAVPVLVACGELVEALVLHGDEQEHAHAGDQAT